MFGHCTCEHIKSGSTLNQSRVDTPGHPLAAPRTTDNKIGGDLLIDVGSGPTLYQVLSGCEVFSKVLLTDFLEVNRQELKKWLKGEGGSLDWTPYIQYVCKLEGRSPSEWKEKAARLREVVSDVLPIDVHRAQPMASDALPSEGADCLVSCFCLESVSPDLDTFTKALGHIGTLLRSEGHLLLIGALQESYYFGGPGVKIPVVPLNEAQVCAALQDYYCTITIPQCHWPLQPPSTFTHSPYSYWAMWVKCLA
uniref:Uncharacterized protein n=1 Tax=Periophthalmus magnuspinnatus TaxID=409849 RepID=A0A3B3Z765_9GOBI